MDWNIIVNETRRTFFENTLTQISETLLKNTQDYKANINLTGGQAGIALFFFYYSQYTKDRKYSDKGFEIFSDVIDKIGKGDNFPSFAGGLAGIGWTIEHLVQQGFIDSDTNKSLEDLDALMHESMMLDIRKGNYNYLHHALGMGLYFLGRIKHGRSREYLNHLITELEFISVKNNKSQMYWESIVDEKEKVKGVQLGLLNGMAGIVLFLGLLNESGIESVKTSKMIHGIIDYILNNQLDRNSKSIFPNRVIEGKEPVFSRLAWGYGDLGIAFSLWRVAQLTNDEELRKKAIQIFEHSAKRENLFENAVVDAGICHGTSGIALIYQRMFNETGIESFGDTARYWLDETLKMSKHEDGLAGYMMWDGTGKGEWKKQEGLLNGIAGVGLTLISAISDIEPAWDRCLLLS